MTTPTPASTQRVYYPTNRTRLLLGGVACLLIAVGFLLLTVQRVGPGGGSLQAGDFIVLIPLVVGLISLVLAQTRKITITPEAFTFHYPVLLAQTPWSNLLRIGPPQQGPQWMTVLHLRQPAAILWAVTSKVAKEPLRLLPLNGYDLAPGSPLRGDLEHYAPQLFR